MTGHHQGPKRKHRTDYRTPSLKRTSCAKCLHYNARHMLRCVFIVKCGILCTIYALCMYSQFGHYPHPKFCLFCGLHCWACPCRKISYSITHSITQLIWCPGNGSFRFGTSGWLLWTLRVLTELRSRWGSHHWMTLTCPVSCSAVLSLTQLLVHCQRQQNYKQDNREQQSGRRTRIYWSCK